MEMIDIIFMLMAIIMVMFKGVTIDIKDGLLKECKVVC